MRKDEIISSWLIFRIIFSIKRYPADNRPIWRSGVLPSWDPSAVGFAVIFSLIRCPQSSTANKAGHRASGVVLVHSFRYAHWREQCGPQEEREEARTQHLIVVSVTQHFDPVFSMPRRPYHLSNHIAHSVWMLEWNTITTRRLPLCHSP